VSVLDRGAAAGSAEGLRTQLGALTGRIGLAHILVFAAALRLVMLAFATPAHPDEVFQYLETAHRLVFGQGIVTWEWRDGIRGWLLPMAVSVPMRVGGWLDPHGGLYLLAPKLVMTGASLLTVAVAWRLGARISRLHALVAGFVTATWFELIYFAPHVLSETASIALILPAAALLMDRERWSDRRVGLAAALLACAGAVRFQNAPAIAALALACCLTDLRRSWRPLLIGGLIGLIPSALCDLAMGDTPFAWMIGNVRMNLLEHRAESFSSSGPFGFAREIWLRFALWTLPLIGLAAVGARRYPALAWMAAVNLVFHSAIAHKEYRFILLSTVALIVLAALGTADWVQASERKGGAAAGRSRLQVLMVAWVLASVSCSFGAFHSQWLKYRPEMDLTAKARGDAALCGFALYQHDFGISGGYAYLHRPVPMLFFIDGADRDPRKDLARAAGGFNTVLTYASRGPELPAAFAPTDCEGVGKDRICLYRRPGACAAPDATYTLNAVLQRYGK
jgi:hypothetical protein